jgi:hypothetical protein
MAPLLGILSAPFQAPALSGSDGGGGGSSSSPRNNPSPYPHLLYIPLVLRHLGYSAFFARFHLITGTYPGDPFFLNITKGTF